MSVASQDKIVLVLGGGIAGVTAALDLAEEGLRVVLVEQGDSLGGRAGHLACMALETCQKCNGCLVEPRLVKALNHPRLEIMTRTSLQTANPGERGFKATLLRATGSGPEKLELEAQAVVLATGFRPFPAKNKPRLGYGLLENVVTVLDLDQELRRTGRICRPSDGRPPQKVAFVQCVGSRDRAGHNYCSRICCGFALRMGRMLHHRFGTEVTVFYMDIQNFGHVFEPALAAAREELSLVRSLPSDVLPGPEGQVVARYCAQPGRPPQDEPFDLLILSVGLTPGDSNPEVSRLFNLELNEHGFFSEAALEEAPARSTGLGAGIFLAGTVVRPMDVAEVVAHAQRAAQETIRYLEEI
ncbi:MAG: CoB--CoM heterodisulfide reductase iron-sulfur subunit A family protein [Deltaproteobacteria bacterium]|nr:CoB--CoM heterodisulfide reductase iron-sulfur subunit A family protein [Deltaproteobacteria bacterium]